MRIIGVHVENDNSKVEEDGTNVIYDLVPTSIRLFGTDLSNNTIVAFTHSPAHRGFKCDNVFHTDPYAVELISDKVGIIDVVLSQREERMYLCAKNSSKGIWYHQGNETWLTLKVEGRLLPLTLQIVLICVLLCLTGLFAGLNLGLMSLDKNELKVIMMKGDENEKRYARTIEPLRRRGNFLLCTILLSNVAINSTLTVLLDQLTSGLIAVIISTLSIVIFGDIVPQV